MLYSSSRDTWGRRAFPPPPVHPGGWYLSGVVLRTWMIAFSRCEALRPQFVQPINAGRGDPPHKTRSQADSKSSGSPPAFTNSCSARRFIIRSVASDWTLAR